MCSEFPLTKTIEIESILLLKSMISKKDCQKYLADKSPHLQGHLLPIFKVISYCPRMSPCQQFCSERGCHCDATNRSYEQGTFLMSINSRYNGTAITFLRC